MEKKVLSFSLERETKGTYRYQEDDKLMPTVGTLYIKKYAVGGIPPQKIRITIEEG